MHEDLLPPLVASFDECVVRVVLISRIDSTHVLRVTLNRDRLLKTWLTAALFRECSSEGNQALVDPSDTFSKLLQLEWPCPISHTVPQEPISRRSSVTASRWSRQ